MVNRRRGIRIVTAVLTAVLLVAAVAFRDQVDNIFFVLFVGVLINIITPGLYEELKTVVHKIDTFLTSLPKERARRKLDDTVEYWKLIDFFRSHSDPYLQYRLDYLYSGLHSITSFLKHMIWIPIYIIYLSRPLEEGERTFVIATGVAMCALSFISLNRAATYFLGGRDIQLKVLELGFEKLTKDTVYQVRQIASKHPDLAAEAEAFEKLAKASLPLHPPDAYAPGSSF